MKNLIKIILGVLVFSSVLVSCEEYELYEGAPITKADYPVLFDYDFAGKEKAPENMMVLADRIFNANKYCFDTIKVATGKLPTLRKVIIGYEKVTKEETKEEEKVDETKSDETTSDESVTKTTSSEELTSTEDANSNKKDTASVDDKPQPIYYPYLTDTVMLANGTFKFLTIQYEGLTSKTKTGKDSLVLDFSNFAAKRKNSKLKTWDLLNTQLRSIPISKTELYARYKRLGIDMLDSKWSDGNSYTSYVMSAITPIYVDSVQVKDIKRGVENHVSFTPTNIFQHIKLNFNVATEAGEDIQGISIKGIVAEVSGVPAGINPYNRQVDIRSTYKVLARCKSDNGILYSADYDVIGLGYGKKAYSNGPGYLQVIINYTATKDGVTKEYTSTSVPISLYNVIKAANILIYDVENEDIAVQNGSNFELNLNGTVTLSVTDTSATAGSTNSSGCKITLK